MKLTVVFLSLILTACARAEGSILDTSKFESQSSFNQEFEQDQSLLPKVEPASLEPVFNYVAALNLALVGELSQLRASADPNCGCLEIADRLASLFPHASLIGGSYELTRIWLEKDEINKKIFKVEIKRSDITKIDKQSAAKELWSASTITNDFIVEKRGQVWVLIDTL